MPFEPGNTARHPTPASSKNRERRLHLRQVQRDRRIDNPLRDAVHRENGAYRAILRYVEDLPRGMCRLLMRQVRDGADADEIERLCRKTLGLESMADILARVEVARWHNDVSDLV